MTTAGRKRAGSSSQRWSQLVAETSDALDLTEGVFTRLRIWRRLRRQCLADRAFDAVDVRHQSGVVV